ncbi:hypothetical protein EGR_07158 [Echinococcus granulosus]|uniref:Uncharacterized protein n=1 Tax=Echinococcus granulosus TaxID=6210 RepID=W6UBP7_ECHGR|nr:hypothetical protein EGR_07158 [Echinococcus granulosus]EUB57966.1 hypothetical protein EGR_07158 [Echinococcus granulosus]
MAPGIRMKEPLRDEKVCCEPRLNQNNAMQSQSCSYHTPGMIRRVGPGHGLRDNAK